MKKTPIPSHVKGRVWDLPRFDAVPGDWVREIVDLGHDRVVSRISGSEFRIWSAENGREVVGAHGDFLAFSRNDTEAGVPWPFTVILDEDRQIKSDVHGILVLSRNNGAPLARFEGHELIPTGARPIRGGAAVVSWAFHDALLVWDATGATLARFSLHKDTVFGALETDDGRIVSWSRDGTFWVDTKSRTPEGIRLTIRNYLVGMTGFEPATP